MKYLIANFKMNKTLGETEEYLKVFLKEFKKEKSGNVYVVCPPAISLYKTSGILKGSGAFTGCQNAQTETIGSCTGEISVNMAKDAGCDYIIIGHSERRAKFGETDEIVMKKTAVTLEAGLIPVLCIGESLEERQSGVYRKKLEQQIKSALLNIPEKQAAKVILAYEPVWAIGTGLSADDGQIEEAMKIIREIISGIYGKKLSESIKVLYGGSFSLKTKNILSLKGVDGALIGKAGLDPIEFFLMGQ